MLHIRCGTISRSTDETRKKRRGSGKIEKGELLNRRGGVSLQNQGVGALCQLYFTKNIFISAINLRLIITKVTIKAHFLPVETERSDGKGRSEGFAPLPTQGKRREPSPTRMQKPSHLITKHF